MTIVRMALQLFFMFVIAAMGVGSTACASDIAIEQTSDGRYAIFLRGPIALGDAVKFATAKQELQSLDWTEVTNDLFLDSPGGNYSEALRIADLLSGGNPIGTKVDANSKCYSACALLFMAGETGGGSAGAFPSRKLHHLAKLGFHAPYLSGVRGQFSGEAIENSFKAAISAVRELMKRGMVPSSLLVAMLSKEPNDFLMIDTVNRAGRWGIQVYGFKKKPVNRLMLCTACENHHSWQEGNESSNNRFCSQSSMLADRSYFTPKKIGTDYTARGLFEFPRGKSTECRVLLRNSVMSFVDDPDEGGPYASGSFGPPGTPINEDESRNFSIAPSDYYNGSTRLSDLGR